MTAVERLENTLSRMKFSGSNELIKNRISFVTMQVGIHYEELDMRLYNTAVSEVNDAANIYNAHIQTTQNNPVKALPRLTDAITLLTAASGRIALIGKLSANYQYDTGLLQQKIASLSEKIKSQQ